MPLGLMATVIIDGQGVAHHPAHQRCSEEFGRQTGLQAEAAN